MYNTYTYINIVCVYIYIYVLIIYVLRERIVWSSEPLYRCLLCSTGLYRPAYVARLTHPSQSLGLATLPFQLLVGGIPTPLKNMSSSVGMMTFPIYGKIKTVPNHQLPIYLLFYSSISPLVFLGQSQATQNPCKIFIDFPKDPLSKSTQLLCPASKTSVLAACSAMTTLVAARSCWSWMKHMRRITLSPYVSGTLW